MDGDEGLTPAQRAAIDGLLGLGAPRPTFDPDLPAELLSVLEPGLSGVADRLGPIELHVNKAALAQVLACESHRVAEADAPFEWTPTTCRGTVAHKAIELAVFRPTSVSPLELVDDAIDRFIGNGEDWTPRDFLRGATEAEIAEVRGGAAEVVTRFQECFPPLNPKWRPRLESPCRVDLCAGRIVLRGKVDLALGRPIGHEARVLIVDVKTGRPYPSHLDDLRYYALLETLRSGVPPFRVASYYLESARWQAEDITPDILVAAARRVVGGVTALAEIHLGERAARLSPGPTCAWCRRRDECPGAREWQEQREALDVGW